MKILWLTSSYPWPGQPYSGIFFQTQVQALARLGVKVTVAAPIPWIPKPLAWLSPSYALKRSAPPLQIDGEVMVLRIPYFGHRFQDYMGTPHHGMAQRILGKLTFNPDLVHGHFAYPIGQAAIQIGRKLGIPSVITLHGSDVNVFAVQRPLGPGRFQRAVSGASLVICVSQALQHLTQQLTGVQALHLPIGIDFRRFTSCRSRDDVRTELGLPIDRQIVLFVGNLLECKGVLVALKALSQMGQQGVLGVFVGNGPLAEAISRTPNCIHREGVANTVIADYLAASDLIILPSFAEGLPTVLVEAGVCGTPVVASEVGGIPELLGKDRGFLIPAGSAEALREAIESILHDRELALTRAKRLQDHVLQHYNVDANAALLLSEYQRLIDHRSDA